MNLHSTPAFLFAVVFGVCIFQSNFTAGGATEPRLSSSSNLGPSAVGLTVERWSGALNVPDPVACSVDPKGRVYVASTARRKAADLDIREYPKWIPDDVGLQSIEEKTAFLRRALAPGMMRVPRGTFKDHNGDGSIDWKDLTAISDKIYQLRDTDGDGHPDKITVFAEGFNAEGTGIAAGVLYHDGWVYATIAPNLWRLKDTDDDGIADIYEIVAHGFGIHIAYGGHDMHGLSLGPDGRIYWSIGDKGVNVTSKEGRHFSRPNEGCVLRIEPDGSHFEIYAHGLRNPQEPAFDDFGDLFAVDNDADFKGEKERFVYIPEGSDAGWRCNFQYMKDRTPWMLEGMSVPQWEGQVAYILPPITLSSDGPCGFKRDPGTALGKEQRGMFFLNEFPSGITRGFRVEQDGPTFKRSELEIIQKGMIGTGLTWHPDGSLLSADWMKGYPIDGKGAITRIDSAGGAADPLRKQTAEILRAGFGRRKVAELSTLLAHPDQRVRIGAQMQLAAQNQGEALLNRARDSKSSIFARIHGVWGYGQLLRRDAAKASALLPLLKDSNAEVRAQTAKVLGESKLTHSECTALIALLGDDSAPRAQVQASLALGRLRVPAALSSLISLAERSWTQPVLRHAVITGLTGCATPEQLAANHSHSSKGVRLASIVALKNLHSPLVAQFLTDSDPAVINEAAHAIHDSEGVPDGLPALARVIQNHKVPAATTIRSINAALRLGTADYAEALVSFALDETVEKTLRAEALGCLLAWKEPSSLDRVDGFARKLTPQPIDKLLSEKVESLLTLKEPSLRQTAVEILIAYSLRAKPEQIYEIIVDSTSSGDLRAAALRLLSGESHGGDIWKKALETALSEVSPPILQQAGLDELMKENPLRALPYYERILKKAATAQKQHAIGLLAGAVHPETDALLGQLAQSLLGGKLEAGLQWDMVAALSKRALSNSTLATFAKQYAESAAGRENWELLSGGDKLRGSEIVINHLGANCMACHAMGESGSAVGPNLRSIGLEKDRRYLLESLIQPSAKLAPGYGITMLSLKDGSQLAGAPMEETDEHVSIKLPDGTTKTILKADVTSKTPPVSVMPPMLGILNSGEIRDVVEFLSSLKWAPKADSKSTAH